MVRTRNGHTLIEVMLSMSIFMLTMGALFSALISQNNFLNQAAAKQEVTFNARKSMSMLVKELRMSKVDLITVFDKPIHEAGPALDHVNGQSVVFQIPVDWDNDGDFFDQWGRIEWGAEGNLDWSLEYYYDVANERIMRRAWDASGVSALETILAENISAFLIQGFMYEANTKQYILHTACEIIEITLTSERDTVGGRLIAQPFNVTLSNRIRWRN